MVIRIERTKKRRRKRKKPVKTSNVILVLMAIFLLLFTLGMIVIFWFKESVPDALIAAVFAACLGEGSILGWIKTSKLKTEEHE